MQGSRPRGSYQWLRTSLGVDFVQFQLLGQGPGQLNRDLTGRSRGTEFLGTRGGFSDSPSVPRRTGSGSQQSGLTLCDTSLSTTLRAALAERGHDGALQKNG